MLPWSLPKLVGLRLRTPGIPRPLEAFRCHPCLIPRCGCSWEGVWATGARAGWRPRPTKENGCHSNSWLSLHLLVRHSCWGAQGQGSRGDRKPGSGRQGPLGLPGADAQEHRLVSQNFLRSRSRRPLPVCRGLEVQGAGADFQRHLTGQTLAQFLPLWAAFWLTHTCCPSSAHTCAHIVTDASHLLCAAHSPAWRTRAQHALSQA